MTYYLVIPASSEAALRSAYAAQKVRGLDLPNEDEKIGSMTAEALPTDTPPGQGRLICGSKRMKASDETGLNARSVPGLQIVREWPRDWVFPPIDPM